MSNRPEDSQSGPAVPGGWRQPTTTSQIQKGPTEPSAAATAPLPTHPEPEQRGGWYVPSGAQERVAAMNAAVELHATSPKEEAFPAQPASEAPPVTTTGEKPEVPSPIASAKSMGEPAPLPLDENAVPVATVAPEPAPTVVEKAASGAGIGEPAPLPLPTDATQVETPATEAKPAEEPAAQATVIETPQAEVAAEEASSPALSETKEMVPDGAALSTDVDYSNYVPGVGFVKKEDAEPKAETKAPEPEPFPSFTAGAAPAESPMFHPLEPVAEPAPKAEEVVAPVVAQSPVTGETGSQQVAAALEEPQANQALVQRYYDVERNVQSLRRKYTAGLMTRDQLQAELRKLMILDEEGHWWMIGLESDRWYKYNGKDWLESTPPGLTPAPGAVPKVPSATAKLAAPQLGGTSAQVRTLSETGPQAAQDDDSGQLSARKPILLDEYGVPLPQQATLEDLGATMVGASAQNLDNTMRTIPSSLRVSPAANPTVAGVAPYDGGVTAPGAVVASQPTQGIPSPVSTQDAQAVKGYQPGWQPDYGPRQRSLVADRHRLAGLLIRLAIVAVFGALLLGVLGIGGAVYYYYSIINKYDAQIAALAATVQGQSQSAQILDSKGAVIFQANDPNLGARIPVPLAQMSPYVIFATVSTENDTFYEDPGFDPVGIFRAILQNLVARQGVSGASTITQQLTRQKVLEPGAAADRSSSRKITEIIVASEIARRYSKNQILEFYLNTVYFGNITYGVESAAKAYFGKSAKDLNIAESAFIAGLIQSPVTYDPVVNDPNDKTHGREAALARMDTVLRLMVKHGCIQMQHKPYDQTPFCVKQTDVDQSILLVTQIKATKFKAPTNTTPAPHFVNYVLQQLESLGFGGGAIYTQGFKVYTTLDSDVQNIAQQAVKAQVTVLKQQGHNVGNGAVLAMRPDDGAIIAMVGSVDFNDANIDGQVNVTLSPRQPGSSIKPFVYLTALERSDKGEYWTPSTVIWDLQQCFGSQAQPYCPVNYDSKFHGPQLLRYALANSYNIPAVKTFAFIGLDRFMNTANRVGLNFPLTKPEDAGYATALGATEVSLYDMVSAYTVLAKGGLRIQPYSIAKITRTVDGKEETVYEVKDHPTTKVAEPGSTYLITNILSDNAARIPAFGQGNILQLPGGRPAAVKTGTTNNFKDNLTIGYTPQLVVGVWVGNTRGEPMVNTSGVTGAAPIWNAVMTGALKNQPIVPFKAPPDVGQVPICPDFGTVFSADCKSAKIDDVYWQPNPPPAPETVIQRLRIDTFSGLIANESCPDYVEDKIFLVLNDTYALNWINTTPEGAKWAKDRGISLPVVPPPTARCDPNTPKPQLTMVNPVSQQQVQGLIEVRGSVFVPNFNRYQLEIGQSFNPTQYGIVYGPVTAQQSAPNSLLGAVDTSRLPNGAYTLRLFAVDNDGHFATVTVPIIINNLVSAPPTAVPQPGQEQPTAIPQPGVQPTATPIVIQSQPADQPTPISVFPPTPAA